MDAICELEPLWASVFGEPPSIRAEAPVLADVLVAALPSAPPYELEATGPAKACVVRPGSAGLRRRCDRV